MAMKPLRLSYFFMIDIPAHRGCLYRLIAKILATQPTKNYLDEVINFKIIKMYAVVKNKNADTTTIID